MSVTPLEKELKIPVRSLTMIREALQNQGATIANPMAREENFLFDSDDGRLAAAGCILRLRRYGEQRLLTFKGPASFEGPIKIRPERELGIEQLGPLREIFESLGFSVVARYQKDRETWQLDDAEVVLDHTPMGDFVEVEGPSHTLETTARAIGLDPTTAVRGSYLSLWREYRERRSHEDLPRDMVFEP